MQLRSAFSVRSWARALVGDGLPPGPDRPPYTGIRTALAMNRAPLRTMLDWVDEYGPVFTFRFLGMQQVWLIGPAANRLVLIERPEAFSWRQGHFGDLVPFLGDGLITTDGAVHDRARRLVAPSFKMERIRGYGDAMVHWIAQAVDELQPGPLEIHAWVRRVALEVACRILFGIDPRDDLCRRLGAEFERGLHYHAVFFHLQLLRGPGTPYAEMIAARRAIDALIYAEIARRRREGAGGDDVLGTLLRARDGHDRLSDVEIRDQIMTLLFAGHDTTTATVSWLLALLGRDRHASDTLTAELDAVVGDGEPTGSDLLGRLPYLQRCVMETLRMFPPAWVGPRLALEDFELHGHRIRAGTPIAYSSWVTHHLPEVWTDPQMFDPNRFEPERMKRLPTGAYVPFGRGPRMCVGMRFGELEVKAVAAVLLRRYRFELLPGQDLRVRMMPTISPRHGVRLRLSARRPPVSGRRGAR